MKRSNRNFIQNNIYYLSRYGQIMSRLECKHIGVIKFWKFFPESYYNTHIINLGTKPVIKSIYSFDWKNNSSNVKN